MLLLLQWLLRDGILSVEDDSLSDSKELGGGCSSRAIMNDDAENDGLSIKRHVIATAATMALVVPQSSSLQERISRTLSTGTINDALSTTAGG